MRFTRKRVNPLKVIIVVLLLGALALGVISARIVWRRSLSSPQVGVEREVSRQDSSLFSRPAKREGPEVDVQDGCVLGDADCELVWIPSARLVSAPIPPPPAQMDPSHQHNSNLKRSRSPAPTMSASKAFPKALAHVDGPTPAVSPQELPSIQSVPLDTPFTFIDAPRTAGLLPAARPLPDSNERTLISEAFLEMSSHSMNPPTPVSVAVMCYIHAVPYDGDLHFSAQ
jgi:hypothetical protein